MSKEDKEIPKTWKDRRGIKNHFVSEIIDGDNIIVVYKYWRKYKQYWQYKCEDKYILERFEWAEEEGK